MKRQQSPIQTVFIRYQPYYNSFFNIKQSDLYKDKTMLDFAFQPLNSYFKKCGCYAINPQLLSLRPNTQILVPLRSCDYHLQIVNAMVNVTLVQIYQNPTDKFLQIEYSFPINPNACVYRFVAIFGETRIEGVVKQKEEAKKQYEKALSEGKKTAYGELNAQSKDILTLKVGNIGPKQQVKIQIVYLQQLTLSYNTFYQLHLPASITPRYLNSFSQDKILQSFRKQPSLQTYGGFNWSFQISLRTTHKVVFFQSNTHKLQLVSENANKTESIISLQKACIPNKDFSFTYTTENYQLPNYVFGRTDKSSSAMLSFIPKFCSLNINDAYKASIQGKNLQGSIDTAKAEYIFLLDRSGSMGGQRIEKAKQALILFIKSLPEDSYFNVVSFGSGSSSIFGEGVRYTNENIDKAVELVKKMDADMGGTEVYNPLFNLLTEKVRNGYPKQIFLLTDGGVSNTEGVIKMVSNNNKFARVHTIGIGNGASQSLIVGCANKGKGHHVFIKDQENPSQKIIQLLSDSLSAVISSINLQFDSDVVQSIIPNPKSLPYILKGEIVNFYITFKGQLANKTNFTFSYEDSQNKLPYSTKIQIDPQTNNESFIDRMAHFKRIRVLQQSHANNSQLEECLYFVKKVDKKAEIIKQSVQNQILSEFTAFICVQKQLVDGKYQQITQTGKVKVFIKSPPPLSQQDEEEQSKFIGIEKKRKLIKSMKMKEFSSMQQQEMILRNFTEKSYDMCSAPPARDYSRPIANCSVKSFAPMKAAKAVKKQQSPGVIDKISSFFKGVFSKKQQQCFNQESKPANLKFSLQQKSQKLQKLQKQQKKEKKEKVQTYSNLIDEVVAGQDSSGCWKDISLIAKIFNSNIESVIRSHKNMLAAAAYLLAKWIEKNYPQKQYSLIVKKGLNYAQKQATNFSEFPSLFDQYI